MRITTALLSEFNHDTFRFGGVIDEITLAGDGQGRDPVIQYREPAARPDGLAPFGEIRRYVTDPKRARAINNSDDEVLTDWFQIWQPQTRWVSLGSATTVALTGFMRSTKGLLRNGVSPRTGEPHPDPSGKEADESFVYVEWLLR